MTTEAQSKALTAAERAGWSFYPGRADVSGSIHLRGNHPKHGGAYWVVGVNGLVTRRPA